jgi:hypothetical protein
MNFGTASIFEAKPQVSSKGWPRPASGAAFPQVVLRTTQQVDVIEKSVALRAARPVHKQQPTDKVAPDTVSPGAVNNNHSRSDVSSVSGPPKPVPVQAVEKEINGWQDLKDIEHFPAAQDAHLKEFVHVLGSQPKAIATQLSYFGHGCRRTGKFMEIKGKKGEICERVGSYGYVIRHADVNDVWWNAELAQLRELKALNKASTQFELQVPVSQPIVLPQKITALAADTGPRRDEEDKETVPPVDPSERGTSVPRGLRTSWSLLALLLVGLGARHLRRQNSQDRSV